MAQVNIPESIGRELYYTYFSIPKDYAVVDFSKLKHFEKQIGKDIPSYDSEKFVVKPDYLISKRGKKNLLGINLDKKEVAMFLEASIGKVVGDHTLYRFLVTPFIPHSKEYYISFQTEADVDRIIFHEEGGIDIEEKWQSTKTVTIGVLDELSEIDCDVLLSGVIDKNERNILHTYIFRLFAYFRAYGFAFLEINPFIIKDDTCIPLDFKGRIDDCTFFVLQKQDIDMYALLEGVSEYASDEERYIRSLDALTGASLKLKMIHENARIWPMISGGGASIIYFDSLVDMGYGNDIGFYGEYSGNPSFDLTYKYSVTVIKKMLVSNAKDKILLIAGANANFTDIANTFKGIQKALEDYVDEIKKQKIRILVRRGGPNVVEGFAHLQKFSKASGIPIHLEGTTYPLPHILTLIDHE